MLKAYVYYGATKTTTKQQILHNLQPFYFPIRTPQDMEGRKAIYLLFIFPLEEVVNERLNKGIYDIGHVVAIHDINKFLYGYRSGNKEIICDCCGRTYRTQEALENHINKGCYNRETNQFKLSKDKVFFNSHHLLARNGFVQYADDESSMDKNMNHDDDWDEEHIQQAIEAHNITKYPDIFEMFGIPLHVQFRGKDCLEEYVKYLLKFDKRRKINHPKHGNPSCLLCSNSGEVSFTEYIKTVNYVMNSTSEQENKYQEMKDCYLCGKPVDDDGVEQSSVSDGDSESSEEEEDEEGQGEIDFQKEFEEEEEREEDFEETE